MTGKLARLRALSWPERRVLLQAALLLPLFWAALRLFGLQRLHAWASRTHGAATDGDTPPGAERTGALIAIAGNHLPLPSTCLTRSLLLIWLLGRRGTRGELRIGVRKAGGGIESHAWVEHMGRPVNDTPAAVGGYAAFDSLPLHEPAALR
jgi:hypothetical protein